MEQSRVSRASQSKERAQSERACYRIWACDGLAGEGSGKWTLLRVECCQQTGVILLLGGASCYLVRRKRRNSQPYVRRERGIFGHFS